ncbi:hypothetical protein BDV10DRAFT_154393 [Aspergillus recurvatus]
MCVLREKFTLLLACFFSYSSPPFSSFLGFSLLYVLFADFCGSHNLCWRSSCISIRRSLCRSIGTGAPRRLNTELRTSR